MMNPALKENLLAFYEHCDVFYGSEIKIREAISTNGLNFDRHFTTWSNMAFLFQRFGWRISGARIMFQGETMMYEISADRIMEFSTIAENEFEFIEMYSDTVYRKTNIKFSKSNSS